MRLLTGRRAELGRLNPTVAVMSLAYEGARADPKRVLFAEGEEPNVLRAAVYFVGTSVGFAEALGRSVAFAGTRRRRCRSASCSGSSSWRTSPSSGQWRMPSLGSPRLIRAELSCR